MKWIKEDVEEAWIAWRNKDAGPSDEAIDRAMRRVMTRAVELVSARGGTMTAEELAEARQETDDGMRRSPTATRDLLEHIAALGARNAVLEAELRRPQRLAADACAKSERLEKELAMARRGFDPGSPAEATIKTLEAQLATEQRLHEGTRMMHREAMRVHESDKESIRRRSLEAGNLERLIAEHGLPAAMRWVVDGEEPQELMDPTPDRCAPCLCTGDDHPHRLFGAIWRCSNCGEIGRWPCSSTCTHDDAATPGHSERVKERSEALWRVVASDAKCHAPKHINCPCTWDPPQACHFPTPDGEPSEAAWQEAHELQQAHDRGAEAMRAACLKDVRDVLANVGAWDRETERIVTAAIEGATP